MNDGTFTPHAECQEALRAIEADPLNLPEGVLAHVRRCAACAETRVHWLAQEDAPCALTPADYFERLPDRILRKLPAKRRTPLASHGLIWAAAAGIIAVASVGGFLAGRANRTPVVEASRQPQPAIDMREVLPDTPFQESEDPVSQLTAMNPEEAEAVLARLEVRSAKP